MIVISVEFDSCLQFAFILFNLEKLFEIFTFFLVIGN